MSHKKEILTAVGTLAIAVGIGFVMQSSEAAQERYGKDARVAVATQGVIPVPDALVSKESDELLDVQAIELTSALKPRPFRCLRPRQACSVALPRRRMFWHHLRPRM